MPVGTVTLAKALKLKNRQVQKVRDLTSRIKATNRYLATTVPDFEASTLYEELRTETERLWKLKAAINGANTPIQPLIYELAELKGLVTFLKGLGDYQGISTNHFYSTQVVVGQAPVINVQISPAKALEEVGALEARIDEIQDQLDSHNARTTIDADI